MPTEKIPPKLEARARAVGPEYPFNVNARLAKRHYALLQLIAEEYDVGISEALRLALEELLDAKVDPELRRMLELAGTLEPDPVWATRHRGEGE
jgi:hypothetical protein